MLNSSNQAALEMRLSQYISNIPEKDKRFKLNLIQYWLSDSDFSDNETENDIAHSFSTIFRVFEAENNPENKSSVFKEWFSLLGLYFLRIDNNPYFSEHRRLDFASFCLFLVDNFLGGDETSRREGRTDHERSLSKKANEGRHRASRDLKKRAIDEYSAASSLLLREGQNLTLETAAELIWPKIRKYNLSSDGRTAIDDEKDPEGRIAAWLGQAARAGKIVPPKELRKK